MHMYRNYILMYLLFLNEYFVFIKNTDYEYEKDIEKSKI
jgi:hypothetical protein